MGHMGAQSFLFVLRRLSIPQPLYFLSDTSTGNNTLHLFYRFCSFSQKRGNYSSDQVWEKAWSMVTSPDLSFADLPPHETCNPGPHVQEGNYPGQALPCAGGSGAGWVSVILG